MNEYLLSNLESIESLLRTAQEYDDIDANIIEDLIKQVTNIVKLIAPNEKLALTILDDMQQNCGKFDDEMATLCELLDGVITDLKRRLNRENNDVQAQILELSAGE